MAHLTGLNMKMSDAVKARCSPPVCGTNSKYSTGCRCELCTAAHRDTKSQYLLRFPEKRNVERERRFAFRGRIGQMKVEAGCVDCGYNAHDAALDYDHLPGSVKKFAISIGWNYPWEDVLAEIAKCEVVCSNCHRIRTVGRLKALRDRSGN